jgi:fatty-acyl-CoA synthase
MLKDKISVFYAVFKSGLSFRDFHLLYKSSKMLKKLNKDKGDTFNVIFDNVVKKHPENDFLVYNGKRLTYREVDELTNKLARGLLGKGFKKGDTVSLMAKNSGEYLIVFIASIKIGVLVSLINDSLKGESLRHCIEQF